MAIGIIQLPLAIKNDQVILARLLRGETVELDVGSGPNDHISTRVRAGWKRSSGLIERVFRAPVIEPDPVLSSYWNLN